MRDFLKTIAAAFIGTALFCGVALAISLIGLIGMAASAGSTSTTSLKDGSVLVLNLDGVMSERSGEATPLDYLQGNVDGSTGLVETLDAIRKAKDNDKVKGIYIEVGVPDIDMAMMQELREALSDFKKSGKWIVAYGDVYTTGAYYVASVADKIYVNPIGGVEWKGLGGQVMFVKDLLAKVGIKVVPFKCGKYKSATEMFTEDHMSQPSREQNERYVGGWWQTICQAVSKSRGISVDSLDSYADRVVSLEDTKNLVGYKMVDGLLYGDQVKDEVKKLLKIDKDDDVPQVTVAGMQSVDNKQKGDKIAVYYACGNIVDVAPQQSFLSGEELIVGDDMVDDLNKLADDDDVKAVVLRINSPGGSAYASEQIWHAVQQLKKEKPVVVSMSGTAASGGYYISCGANYIFAEPTTITGSIGIFGITMDQSELMTKKLGLSFDAIKTNRNTLIGSTTSPMTQEQAGYIQAGINRGYNLFKSRVAAGRHLSMDAVEERAQGHVFLGSDALGLKLVDGLGGLDKAVAKAAKLAKLDKYHSVNYPEPEDFLSEIFDDSSSSNSRLDEHLHTLLGDFYEPFMIIRRAKGMNRLQARMPYIIKVE